MAIGDALRLLQGHAEQWLELEALLTSEHLGDQLVEVQIDELRLLERVLPGGERRARGVRAPRWEEDAFKAPTELRPWLNFKLCSVSAAHRPPGVGRFTEAISREWRLEGGPHRLCAKDTAAVLNAAASAHLNGSPRRSAMPLGGTTARPCAKSARCSSLRSASGTALP